MGIINASLEQVAAGDIVILGIPLDVNSSFMQGPAQAPPLIIEALESDSANYFTESLTNLDEHPRLKWIGNQSANEYLDIGQPVLSILKQEAIPITLGGDHSITYPIVKEIASHHENLTILHFDAHGDLYDVLDGNRHSHACPFARIMEAELANRLIQVGIRTMTAHQKEQVDRFDVEVWQMKDLPLLKPLVLEGPVYISFDMDVLDPAFAPGVSHHEPGGLSNREAIEIIQQLKATNIVGIDLVEYNPKKDINGVTAMTAAKILKELIDKLI
ncbi:MAG: agmatinase [Cyclobacteriaceae bacterium]